MRFTTTLCMCLLTTAANAAEPTVLATLDEVPVGISASSDGRVFVSFSRAIDATVSMSVAELVGGKPVAFPPGFDQKDGLPGAKRLLSVQSVVVDAKDRLWMLDCGKVGTNAVEPGTAKLVAYDLEARRVAHTIVFPKEVAGAKSFLNDLRVDLDRGKAGTIFLTDASAEAGGLIVVDIASGDATRALENHRSVRPDKALVPAADGKPLIQKAGPDKGEPFMVGADGIALSADARWLYFTPLTSRRLYRVSTDALVAGTLPDRAIEDLGDKGFAADGMLIDAADRLYVTDFEGNAIRRRSASGAWEVVAKSERLSWPDTLTLMPDGGLLVTATQIQRGARVQGWDRRQRPFQILRIATDSRPEP